MSNDGGPAVDSSREAVERMAHDCDGHAQWLRDRTPEGGTAGLAEIYGRIAATLRTLLTERDTLAAANATLAEEIEEITAIADRGVVLHGEAAEIMSSLEAQRDAATAERDALRDEWEEIAAGITTEQPEVGALWPMVSEELGNLAAVRNLFKNETAAHNRTKAERDQLREALEKAAIAAEVESAGPAIAIIEAAIAIIEAALTSAKEPSA